jgi:hypothetical protein
MATTGDFNLAIDTSGSSARDRLGARRLDPGGLSPRARRGGGTAPTYSIGTHSRARATQRPCFTM